MERTERIRIATWQGPIVENDVDANLAKVYEVIQQGIEQDVDFLCFPETYLSGYSPEAIRESALKLADERIQRFIRSTANHNIVVLVGLCEQKEDGIYNGQLVMYQGVLLGVQYKTMLTQGYDHLYFQPNWDQHVFEAKGLKFGVSICHSTSFVEPSLYLRWKGVRLLFTPHYNNIGPYFRLPDGSEFTFWDHRTMVLNNQAALATLLKMVVVRSNIVVVERHALGAGDSNIWDMDGRLVAAGRPFTEQLVTAEFARSYFDYNVIPRQEVPAELLGRIHEAAKQFHASGMEKG
jgi:predicted amidohydrolase